MAEADLWTEECALGYARKALAGFGFTSVPLRLVSFRQNALFHASEHGLLLRIYSPFEDPAKSAFTVDVARRLALAGFAAQRLHSLALTALVEVDGVSVSAWEWLDESGHADSDFAAFGHLLRQFHDLDLPLPDPVPVFDPLARIERRLKRLQAPDALPSIHLQQLMAEFERLREHRYELHESELGWCTIHGDALRGNAISTSSGLKLIDFDSVCKGPREWDLAPTWISARRYGLGASVIEDFARGYGVSTDEVERLELAIAVKELSMLVVLALRYRENADKAADLDRRLQALAAGETAALWTAAS